MHLGDAVSDIRTSSGSSAVSAFVFADAGLRCEFGELENIVCSFVDGRDWFVEIFFDLKCCIGRDVVISELEELFRKDER